MARKKQPKTARPARFGHIEAMYNWGERGLWDYSEQNARVVKPSRSMLTRSPTWGSTQLKFLPQRYDVRGHDHPRQDVKPYPLKAGKPVRAGGDDPASLAKFGSLAVPVVDAALSPAEQKRINVYYEYPDKAITNRKVGGLTDYWTSKAGVPYSHIMINRPSMNSEYVLLHETLHVVRHSPTAGRDRDIEEAKTDLETIARLPYASFLRMKKTHTGYYRFLPGDPWQNAVHDRILLTGSIERSLSGEEARRRVDRVFNRTRLSRLRITETLKRDACGCAKSKRQSSRMSPEDVDRYFKVALKDGTRIDIHLSLNGRLTKPEVRDLIRRQYRNAVAVWEWKDGRLTKF